MPNVLITGANRGLGLEFVRSFAADGWRVHACARNIEKAKKVKALSGDVICHKLDVTNGLKVASLARELADEPLDLLINNAGVYGPRTGFGETDYEEWASVLQVNTMAPLRVVERFVGVLEKSAGKTIVNISSRMGSIASNSSGSSYIYRSSKAALNMVTRGLSVDLGPKGFTVISFHPGWVQTDMGGESADIPAEDSIAGMRKVIAGLTPEDNGKFFNYDGSEIDW
ncbi:SDR family oxidoreductase [Pelagibius litoralis]|uniref:SDR family oxidoreductase n=1 Tax=Pelagibius litoralis TaxID=374515 RepID=A0A967F352_9PROT|nr:SDR family oxidoreductase [Pelagibius litoralis]NIA72142.1 SDR family oxidoreductase [Pelagibius litoralis]